MGALQHPSKIYVKTMDTGEEVKLGAVTIAANTELDTVQVLLYIKGTLGGTEQLSVKVYGDSGYSNLFCQSSLAALSGLSPVPSGNWNGWLSLSFARQNLGAGQTYYLALASQNYTRNADTFYLSAQYDWPNMTGNVKANLPGTYPKAFLIYGYETLDYNQ